MHLGTPAPRNRARYPESETVNLIGPGNRMDNHQVLSETHLEGGIVQRQISQTDNFKEEAVVMPEQLEKKHVSMLDLTAEDLLGKVEVNSSKVEGEVDTTSANCETKSNGHSNGGLNGVSGDESEAEIDGSDSEADNKESDFNLHANPQCDKKIEPELADNLECNITLTSDKVAESDGNKLQAEQTMGPNSEPDDVSYDIDLDKSVPELVTEYEMISKQSNTLSQGLLQTESTFVSSSSSVQASKIPVAVDRKISSVITRQNTYTVESSGSSSDTTNEVSITENNEIENECESSIDLLLQRQNTYTVQTCNVQESGETSTHQQLNCVSSHPNSQQILEKDEFNEFNTSENTEEISEGNIKQTLNAEEKCELMVGSELLSFLDTVPRSTAKEKSIESVHMVEETFSETIISKLGAQSNPEPEEPLYKEPEDALDPYFHHKSSAIDNGESIEKVEDQYVTAEEVRTQKHKVMVKDELLSEEAVLSVNNPHAQTNTGVEINDLTKEPTIMEETSLLSSHIPLIVPDKSELVTEYEMISKQSNTLSQSLLQTESTFVSSSSSSSVQASKIPVAVDRKISSVITRQNTYTVESSGSSSDTTNEVSITENNEIENECESSIDLLLQRQNTYTVQTCNVQESGETSTHQQLNCVSSHHNSQQILEQDEVNGFNTAETTEEILEGNIKQTLNAEEKSELMVGSELLSFLDNVPRSSDVDSKLEVELPAAQFIPELSNAKEKSIESVHMVEETFSETIISKLGAQSDHEPEEPLYKEPEDALDPELCHPKLSAIDNEESEERVEDEYVTAEEVRTQKHKVVIKDELLSEEAVLSVNIPHAQTNTAVEIEDLTKEPILMEENSLLSSHIPLIIPVGVITFCTDNTGVEKVDLDKKFENENVRTSKDVEQLIRDIRDPNLDCSLEDIEAMIEGKELIPPTEDLNRVSPEFSTAVTLLDQVLFTILIIFFPTQLL